MSYPIFPEGTTKKLEISVSPSSEAVSDGSQPASAALGPVCFAEQDVVLPWVISRGLISIHRKKQTEI